MQVHELAALYALGTLDRSERAEFERHLLVGCAPCEAELRIFREVAGHIGASTSADPAAFLKQQVLNRALSSPQSPGLMLSEPGLFIKCSAEIPWSEMAPGVAFKRLFVDETRHCLTAIIRMDPGATYPSHRHKDVEELFMISGDLHVAGEIMRAGDYCRAEPDTVHGVTSTQAGCLFLLCASQLNQVIP